MAGLEGLRCVSATYEGVSISTIRGQKRAPKSSPSDHGLGKRTIVGTTVKKLGGLDKLYGRFALLRHVVPPSFGVPSHWDLMLENGCVLLTFQLLELPSCGRPSSMLALDAKRLPDHRKRYLSYEGPIEPLRSSSNVVITNDTSTDLKAPGASGRRMTEPALGGLREVVPSGRGHVARLAGGTYEAEWPAGEEQQTVRLTSESLKAVIRIPACEVGANTSLGIVTWQLDVGSGDSL